MDKPLTRKAQTAACNTILRNQHGIQVIRCSLPIPATLNVYFVRDPVPTIVDAPPQGSRYVEELDRGLRTVGCSVRDIERIIITHPHFDHYGSAQSIADKSGAEIWVFGEGAHWIEHYEEELDSEERHRRALLTMCGVPGPDVDYVTEYYRKAHCFARGARISRYLAAGETLELGTATFGVTHVPGHTPFCILLHDADSGLAFTGDFLPPDIPANPLVQWTNIRSDDYRATKSYVRSLQNVSGMDIETALPGHGPIIGHPSDRIECLLTLIGERRMAVLKALTKGSKTPFLIAQEIFPGFPRESLFRTISDIMGQLEMLEDAGAVGRTETEPFFFTRTS